jgi:hypothetical protein
MTDFQTELREAHALAERELGCTTDELRKMLYRLGWGAADVMRAVRADDWTTKFRARLARIDEDIRAETETKIATVIRNTFERGPSAMAALDDPKIASLLPAKLAALTKQYATSDGNRIIVGPTGIGKSLALVALGKRLARERVTEAVAKVVNDAGGNPLRYQLQCVSTHEPFAWFRATDLAKARREHSLGDGDAPLVVAAKSEYVVAIDDLGWESQSDAAIPEILASRYDAKRVTLITSALTPMELQTRYGAAVVRRALGDPETGKVISLFKPVELAGGSK